MRKSYPVLTVILLAALLNTGCQALSAGIAGKTSCCDGLLNRCTGTSTQVRIESTGRGGTSDVVPGKSMDILKSLPFSTILQ